jgi:hypothetical protein
MVPRIPHARVVKSLRGYLGELVVVGGFFYEMIFFEVRNRETRCIAYSDVLGLEINLSLGDVLSSLVSETGSCLPVSGIA